MTFRWPELLWLFALIPALVALYLLLLRRRKRFSLRFPSLTLVKEAIGPRQQFRRHLPPLLFLIALAGMIVAVARPTAVISLPSQHELVILAIDLSGSMRATDVEPTRIAAAQAAARGFIADQPRRTRIGVVSFAAAASVVQVPTTDRQAILESIERLQLQRGTAIGSAILVSLKLIFPDVEFDLRSSNPRVAPARGARSDASRDPGASDQKGADSAPVKSVAPGSYASAAIIVLTDGQATTGPDPIESARMAAERGVRVFTVGVGTKAGEIVGSDGWSMRVRLDEDTLQKIADITRAEYYHAGTALDLKKVYEALNGKLVFEKKETEVTALFSAAAAALALAAAMLSVLWFGRVL